MVLWEHSEVLGSSTNILCRGMVSVLKDIRDSALQTEDMENKSNIRSWHIYWNQPFKEEFMTLLGALKSSP